MPRPDLSRQEFLNICLQRLRTIDPRGHEALIPYMNGEKQKDIGARLGIKQSAVSHRVSKARRILNEQIMTEVRRNLRLDRPEYYEEEEDWQIHE